MTYNGNVMKTICDCGEEIIQEKNDPWIHVDSGNERCETSEGDETDEFARPKQEDDLAMFKFITFGR